MTPSNYVPDVRRRQVTPLYDTISIPTTTAVGAQRIFFGSLAGTVGRQNTNMTQAFQLPGIEAFKVMALRFVWVDGAVADLVSLSTNYVLQLIRGRAVELEAPIEYFAGGAGIYAGTAGTHEANGIPDPRAVAGLGDYPITIEGGDHFEVQLNGATFATTAALVMRVYLDGWFDKGVQ